MSTIKTIKLVETINDTVDELQYPEDTGLVNQKIDVKKLDLENILVRMFQLIDISSSTIDELDGVIISRDILLDVDLYQKLTKFIPQIKDFLKSSYLTSLHNNSVKKQKFPAINLFRQVLRFNNLKMSPFVISQGYEKATGKKITKRFFRIDKFTYL